MTTKVIDLYTITALTNLHAGRGDSNYGIVDNEVQRDPVLDIPVIHSSSLKGAFRQLFKDNQISPTDILNIFGNEVKDSKLIQPGSYTFHEARLLSLPARSEEIPFHNGTSPHRLGELISLLKNFGIKDISLKEVNSVSKGKPCASYAGPVDEFEATTLTEDQSKNLESFQKLQLLPANVALFHNNDFMEICERLPVIARNQLENGVSQNLFYEEVVPRQTRFAFLVERPEGNDKFYDHLKALGFRVQIGANASIGYGVCLLNRIQFKTEEKS
jgi:CRISPR-associated protein Cmr4